MDEIERTAREIFKEAVNPDNWNMTWDTAPPHYRDVCLMRARERIEARKKMH